MTTKDLTYGALGIGLLTIASQLSFHLGPIPFTCQTLAVFILALLYPLRLFLCLYGVYLLMGLIGLPVFANFSGGVGYLLSPSFGFLLAFLLAGVIIAYYRDRGKSILLGLLLAQVIIYLIGLTYMAWILNGHLAKGLNFKQILQLGCLPFIPGDLVKAWLAYRISQILSPQLHFSH
ncbi:biotin transporter BioY [Facklamia hominis]|uniref:biotin transporter BioY n=1 Tax=Facklamia hominis TaxID=178214 RepID=UPI00101C4CE9|nr:biotin transporter BioY [Facklamia hominis]RYC98016.1 biotin transporter BioY [Facklamia hominis]